MKSSITFICPYFGKLPEYFPVWLKTCEYNKDIKWIVFTDDKTIFNYPNNVKKVNMTFDELKKNIIKKIKINIKIEKPYKLCDFKPLYGKIFEDYIKNDDFWGHCDIDCIFGNIRKFVTEDILKKYDKIFCLGHMTLYRNTPTVNDRYKIKINEIDYKDILTRPENCCFDESYTTYSINTIYKKNNIPIYNKETYFDISPSYYDFRRGYYIKEKHYVEKNNNCIFEWNNGKLLAKNIKENKIVEKEYIYVHFQKRMIKNKIKEIDKCNHFLLIPNEIISINQNIDYANLEKYIKRKKLFYKEYFKIKYRNLKYKIKRLIKKNILKVE